MDSSDEPSNNQIGLEYINNALYKGSNHFLNISSLLAFFGGRHVISDFYDHRQDILCNPLVKIVILFTIIYMNIKNLKVAILIFFFYILYIDNYITNDCDKEYIQSIK